MAETAECPVRSDLVQGRALLRLTLTPVLAQPAAFGARFFAILFGRAPALRRLFPANLLPTQARLAQMLAVIVAGLDTPDVLAATLRALGARHRGYGAKHAHYVAFGEALISALADSNGADFSADARSAWQRLYGWVAEQMQRG